MPCGRGIRSPGHQLPHDLALPRRQRVQVGAVGRDGEVASHDELVAATHREAVHRGEHGLAERCEVLFSPSFEQLAPRELADWIVADRLPVRFQLQLHKQLWGDEPGR